MISNRRANICEKRDNFGEAYVRFIQTVTAWDIYSLASTTVILLEFLSHTDTGCLGAIVKTLYPERENRMLFAMNLCELIENCSAKWLRNQL